MHHLPAEEAAAYLAEHAQPRARLQGGDLTGIEMQETEVELSVCVGQPAVERLAGSILDFGMDDLALDLDLHSRPQVTNCSDMRLVDVTQRQMEQQALYIMDAEPPQAGKNRLADALEFGQPGQGALAFDMHDRV